MGFYQILIEQQDKIQKSPSSSEETQSTIQTVLSDSHLDNTKPLDDNADKSEDAVEPTEPDKPVETDAVADDNADADKSGDTVEQAEPDKPAETDAVADDKVENTQISEDAKE